MAGGRVAPGREPARHGGDGQVAGIDVGDLVPLDRARHPPSGLARHRVRRRHGPVARVLVVVDEHPLAPLLLPPRRGGDVGETPLELARQGQSRSADVGEAPARLDGDVDVDAARPRRLREPDERVLLEHGARLEGHTSHRVEGNAGLGVEVDAKLVRVIGVAPSHRPRVEVEASQVDRPQDVGHVHRAQLLGAAPAREGHRDGLEPRRTARRYPLLVEERPLGPVGVALEHRRALAHAPQGAGPDGEVVPHEVELGLAPGREEDLVRVGDLHAVTVDLDRDGGHPGGHVSMVARICPRPPSRATTRPPVRATGTADRVRATGRPRGTARDHE